ncbi:(deoxy)nucleoside triphosphate pyrophosphohydrolase [Verrucomicrobia bacterium S94]|nr:(deoxy)nucleoside triphosphate pyrophosphohydrolase [Verrucomicrobia bacterium S94]
MKKLIHVVCLVLADRKGLFFAAQRPVGKSQSLLWEFPGGKVEPGENAEDALRREIREELSWTVGELKRLPDSTHEYDFGTIRLTPFLHECVERPLISLTEHIDSKWVVPSEWTLLKWAPADIPIVEHLVKEVLVYA